MSFLSEINQFAHPALLGLLVLIPLWLIWYLFWYDKRRLIIRLSYNPHKLKKPSLRVAFLRHLPLLLQLTALGFMTIALARPQTVLETAERYAEGIDIMLLLDTSSSMETEDFPPNRLEVAKATARQFVSNRKDDRIGIVLFAEGAFSYAPLTLDYDLLDQMITAINFKTLPKQGTALGTAISTGINRLRDSKSPSKVMILLTDGANNRGKIDPITAARLASTYKIKIYCIGIGKRDYLRKSPMSSSYVRPDLDEKTLQKVAELTGAKFFRSNDPQSLQKVFNQISLLETREVKEEIYKEATDHYPFFLKIAAACLLAAFLLMISFIYNPLEQ